MNSLPPKFYAGLQVEDGTRIGTIERSLTPEQVRVASSFAAALPYPYYIVQWHAWKTKGRPIAMGKQMRKLERQTICEAFLFAPELEVKQALCA